MNPSALRFRFDDPGYFGFGRSVSENLPPARRIRSELLANAVRVTRDLFPDLERELCSVNSLPGWEREIEYFVAPDPRVQAFCLPYRSDSDDGFSVVMSSGLIERLKLSEIRFVVGHEIGHFVCEHWRYPAEIEVEGNDGIRMLAMRLQQFSEISADRFGLLASGSLEAGSSAMIKTATGLGEPHVMPDIPSILAQHRDLSAIGGSGPAVWNSHPIISLRIRALLRFLPVFRLLSRNQIVVAGELEEIDQQIFQDFEKSSGYLLEGLQRRYLESVKTWGLLSILAAEGFLSRGDQRILAAHLGEERAGKALNLARSHTFGFADVLGERLEEACRGARCTAVVEREALLVSLREIIEERGETNENQLRVLGKIRKALIG